MNKKAFLLFLFVVCLLVGGVVAQPLPPGLKRYVSSVSFPAIGGVSPAVLYKSIAPGNYKVTMEWELTNDVNQDDVEINIRPSFVPSFHRAPHLTPQDGFVIAQHVFRAPCLIVSDAKKQLTIIPDLDLLKNNTSFNWYMDMNAPVNVLTIGLGKTEVADHVLFKKKKGASFPKGIISAGFYIFTNDIKDSLCNPWRNALSFMWQKWGRPLYQKGEPLPAKDLDEYVKQTYEWAFQNWKTAVWQEFELNGKRVGAPVFIVNVTQSPNYKGEVNEREFRSVWNQAWFSSLRSASGLYRYARRTGNEKLKQYALQTKELALQFPQYNGFFPSVIATEMEEVTIDGRKYNRSKGWGTKYFGNSNRNPYTRDVAQSPYHILDMSFTANQMLKWYTQLEKDRRLLSYSRTYADALVKTQFENGFFPGWLSLNGFKPMEHLNASPETAMSVTFLLNLYGITKDARYKNSATKAMQAVIKNNIMQGQWEDFETYWSCSRYGSDNLVGKKVERNNMFKQNTLSIYYTAEALLAMYNCTKDKKYLQYGQRVLDELLMAQAVWQPPYMAIRTLGGFGVMNADAEWNDSRQSLFAELIMDYGKLLNNKEYTERGIAALKASFTMMYTPLNPHTMQQWQQRYPFFGKEDYGFMMENYGHDGITDSEGLGIGEFTIYDWGNGAAAEAYNRIVDHYGKNIIK